MMSVEFDVQDKFLKPFVKFHLHQINKAESVGDEGDWQVKLGDGTLISCYMVWVQGEVTGVNREEDTLTLSDKCGGHVTVETVSVSPGNGNWAWLKDKEQYIQVIGQLIAPDRIRCTKVTDLTEQRHCIQMWDLEVSELHNLLAGTIEMSEL